MLYLLFNLDTPFAYNPDSGNLLVDMRIFNSGSTPGFGTLVLDAANVAGDSVSEVVAENQGSLGVNSLTGIAGTAGLITDFTVTPVPEPCSLSLLAAGLAATGVLVKRLKGKGSVGVAQSDKTRQQ